MSEDKQPGQEGYETATEVKEKYERRLKEFNKLLAEQIPINDELASELVMSDDDMEVARCSILDWVLTANRRLKKLHAAIEELEQRNATLTKERDDAKTQADQRDLVIKGMKAWNDTRKPIEVIPPGTRVDIYDGYRPIGITGTVLQVIYSEKDTIAYKVSWWDGTRGNMATLRAVEVKPTNQDVLLSTLENTTDVKF